MSDTPGILIVDDDEFMRRMLQRILAPVCTRVDTDSSALAAIARLRQPQSAPDIIVLDLKMPDMDGVQFARLLSESGYSGAVILISGADERILQTTATLLRRQGIVVLGYFKKPVAGNDLLALIDRWQPPQQNPSHAASKPFSADEVKAGLQAGQLFNVYQPKVRFDNGRVVGFETLVRWRHPEHGVIAPDRFLPQLHEPADIQQLTHTVIAQAFADTADWLRRDNTPSLALNVTMEDMQHGQFAQSLCELAEQYGIPPHKITVEITESSTIDDALRAIDSATSLRIKGFSLSIDDFGTGHSTLSQLRDMPFNELKIDRGFVTGASIDNTRSSILLASVSLAKQLDMTVVAEGIELEADWQYAKQAGCDYAQGYFIARPLAHDDLASWQAQWQERAAQLT